MNQAPFQVTEGPHRFVCPCAYPLSCTGSESAREDTASYTNYECTEGHRWQYVNDTVWSQGNGWKYRGLVEAQS